MKSAHSETSDPVTAAKDLSKSLRHQRHLTKRRLTDPLPSDGSEEENLKPIHETLLRDDDSIKRLEL